MKIWHYVLIVLAIIIIGVVVYSVVFKKKTGTAGPSTEKPKPQVNQGGAPRTEAQPGGENGTGGAD